MRSAWGDQAAAATQALLRMRQRGPGLNASARAGQPSQLTWPGVRPSKGTWLVGQVTFLQEALPLGVPVGHSSTV